jgi:hypothetical protein
MASGAKRLNYEIDGLIFDELSGNFYMTEQRHLMHKIIELSANPI